MQTRKFDIAQSDGWVPLTDAATQVLIQLRTEGRVEVVVNTLEPSVDPVQGILLTSSGFPVFSAMGLDEADVVWVRIVGSATDTDTLTIMDNGVVPT